MRNFSRTVRYICGCFGAACAFASAACGGGSSLPTAPSSTSSPATGLGVSTYTYTNDIRPILTSDCLSCHGPSRQEQGYNFSTYQGVLRAVNIGSAQSPLVVATGPGGLMYQELTGNAAQKSQIIYDWVVNSHAAQ